MLSFLRGLLFDNLGIKLVALLLAVALYLHVYTERPAVMEVLFPLEITGLADTLALVGPPHEAVRAELLGTGKQLLRIRLTEPRIKVSLAGVGPGRYERTLVADDLPILAEEHIEVQRLISPRVISLEIDVASERSLPVAPRISGQPRPGWTWLGAYTAEPANVTVRGPRSEMDQIDSLRLMPVRIDGRSESLKVTASPDTLPFGCQAATTEILLTVQLQKTSRSGP